MNQCDVEADSPMRSTLAVASDEALVISAKAGMHLAYAELCRRHSTGTFRTIHRITQSKEDAEDALQESLLKAFTHLNAFDEKSKFSTWLTRIAINSALMVLRKRRSHPESSSEDDMLSKLQDSNPASDPERNIIERERDFTLRKAVRRLPPLLREPTEIRYLQEVSVSEVAARIRVSLAATKTRLLRARKSLIRALSEDEGLHGAVSKLERTRRSGCEDRRAAEARPQIEKRVLSQEKAIPNPWALTRRNRSL